MLLLLSLFLSASPPAQTPPENVQLVASDAPKHLDEMLASAEVLLKTHENVTLTLKPGLYRGPVVLRKTHSGLRLVMSEKAAFVLDWATTIITVLDAKDIVLDGIVAKHTIKVCPQGANVIDVFRSQDVTIQNSRLDGSGHVNVFVEDSTHVKVLDNIIYNSTAAGVWAKKSEVHVEGNQIFGGPSEKNVCLRLDETRGEVRHNVISHCGVSHEVLNSHKTKVVDNFWGLQSLPMIDRNLFDPSRYRPARTVDGKRNQIFLERNYKDADFSLSLTQRKKSLTHTATLQDYDAFFAQDRSANCVAGVMGATKEGSLFWQGINGHDGLDGTQAASLYALVWKTRHQRTTLKNPICRRGYFLKGDRLTAFNILRPSRAGLSFQTDMSSEGFYALLSADNLQGDYLFELGGPSDDIYLRQKPIKTQKVTLPQRKECLKSFQAPREIEEGVVYASPSLGKKITRLPTEDLFAHLGFRTCQASVVKGVRGHWSLAARNLHDESRSTWQEGWVFVPLEDT